MKKITNIALIGALCFGSVSTLLVGSQTRQRPIPGRRFTGLGVPVNPYVPVQPKKQSTVQKVYPIQQIPQIQPVYPMHTPQQVQPVYPLYSTTRQQSMPMRTSQSSRVNALRIAIAVTQAAAAIGLDASNLVMQVASFVQKNEPKLRQLKAELSQAPRLTNTREKIALGQKTFAEATNLLKDSEPLLAILFGMIKHFRPVVSVIKPEAGIKVDQAVDLMSQILLIVLDTMQNFAQLGQPVGEIQPLIVDPQPVIELPAKAKQVQQVYPKLL